MTFLRVKVSFSQIASLYALCYDTKKQRKGEHIWINSHKSRQTASAGTLRFWSRSRQFKPHLSTTEELKTELAAMREAYRPFLENHAPAFESLRRRMDLTSFLRDGQPVTIPEYGGPIGVCKKTYETTFELPALLAGQSVYIHFDGADYRAVVTVNDTFGGEHEGFFSPFEFEITGIVKDGTNRLKVELYNDHIYMGNDPGGSEETEGDKLYAATGLGWDGPLDGWHHCPSGTGIYNRVYVEIRNSVHISDLYIRPLDGKAEAWLEIQNDRSLKTTALRRRRRASSAWATA